RGHVESGFTQCVQQVPVKVQYRTAGTWVTRKSDTTNDRGVFKVLVRDTVGRYRAVAPVFHITDQQAGIDHVCDRAKSPRKRHHH
ncbi:MAG TPA: hypothetical protein VFK89_05010, partial [Actinomycetota bacterium]|nr:hypothetical protein [Actinomycetota bacterium]